MISVSNKPARFPDKKNPMVCLYKTTVLVFLFLVIGLSSLSAQSAQEEEKKYVMGNTLHFGIIGLGYVNFYDTRKAGFFGEGDIFFRLVDNLYFGFGGSAYLIIARAEVAGYKFGIFHPVFGVLDLTLKYAVPLTSFMAINFGLGVSTSLSTFSFLSFGYSPLTELAFRAGNFNLRISFKYHFLYSVAYEEVGSLNANLLSFGLVFGSAF